MDVLDKEVQGDRWAVRLSGRLDRGYAPQLAAVVEEAWRSGAKELYIDLRAVSSFDTAGVSSLIDSIGRGERQNLRIKLRSPNQNLLDYLSLVEVDRLIATKPAPAKEPRLQHLGRIASPFLKAFKVKFLLLSETVYWVVVGPFKKKGVRWDRVGQEIVFVGANAIPIVTLISVLMGIVLAYQAAVQLRQFGATIYIADLVGISITRELGPLLTAIIVAGRSGSANAAEIGTMVVSEELDAIRQMGVNPTRFLLVPKILGLAISLPCLALMGSAVGIASAALYATMKVDIGMEAYLEETRLALMSSDLYQGMFKALVFGLIIGATGCGQGLEVKGGAGEVGRATTMAVVVSIFYIIAWDTIFTFIL